MLAGSIVFLQFKIFKNYKIMFMISSKSETSRSSETSLNFYTSITQNLQEKPANSETTVHSKESIVFRKFQRHNKFKNCKISEKSGSEFVKSPRGIFEISCLQIPQNLQNDFVVICELPTYEILRNCTIICWYFVGNTETFQLHPPNKHATKISKSSWFVFSTAYWSLKLWITKNSKAADL